MAIPALELQQVSKTKPVLVGGEVSEVEVLRGVTFAVSEGEVVTLLGPSGSGKSTLLRLVNRMEDPTSGQILLGGVDTGSIEVRELRRRVGMVFQTPAPLEGTVGDNICYGLQLRGQACDAAAYLDLVGLERGLLSRPATALSVGQQQRVAIARALANEPGVLLLDEPTSALDQSASRNILDLIQRLNRDLRLTVLMVTHVLEHAKAVGTRVVLLAGGCMVEEGPSADFFTEPQSETARLFIRGELTTDVR